MLMIILTKKIKVKPELLQKTKRTKRGLSLRFPKSQRILSMPLRSDKAEKIVRRGMKKT